MKRNKRRSGRALLAAALAMLLLCGCAPMPKTPPDVCGRDFEAEIAWHAEGVTLRALLTVEYGEAEGPEVTLRFSEPKAMKGLCLRSLGGQTEAWLGGVRFPVKDAGALLRGAELLLRCRFPETVYRAEENGRRLWVAVGSYLGHRLEARLSAPEGIPLGLTWGETVLEVLRFLPASAST